MNPVVVALQEEVFVKRDAPIAAGVKLDHPAAHTVGIELLIPRCIERVGEIDSFAVAAYFHHLRAASQRLVGLFRMWRAIDNAADAHRAGLFRIEWIGDVVLQELARPPAGDI